MASSSIPGVSSILIDCIKWHRKALKDQLRDEQTRVDTYVYHNPLTEVVIVRDGLEVGYASELGVGGVPVLFLAADFGQRPGDKEIDIC